MAPVSALLRASVPTATVFKCPSSGATLDRPRQTCCPSRPLKGATEKNYVWRNCLRMTQCVLPLKALEPAQDEARPWHGPLACVESITRKSSVAGATLMLQTSLRKFIGLLKKKKNTCFKMAAPWRPGCEGPGGGRGTVGCAPACERGWRLRRTWFSIGDEVEGSVPFRRRGSLTVDDGESLNLSFFAIKWGHRVPAIGLSACEMRQPVPGIALSSFPHHFFYYYCHRRHVYELEVSRDRNRDDMKAPGLSKLQIQNYSLPRWGRLEKERIFAAMGVI